MSDNASMKLKHLSLQNFRAFEQLDMAFGSRLTLLLGANGSGKTTVLDALAIGLGAVLSYLPAVAGKGFRKRGELHQVKNRLAPYARVTLETQTGLQWDRTQRRDKSKATAKAIPQACGLKLLEDYLDEQLVEPLNSGSDYLLPVFAYYGVSRAVLELPFSRKGFPKSHSRLEALANALEAQSSFKSAFVWFYNKENEEHRLQKEWRSFDASLKELDAVRRAIQDIFPDISNPRIELNPLRPCVSTSA